MLFTLRKRLRTCSGVTLSFAIAAIAVACASGEDARRERELIVFNAGSLALPLRAVLDSFSVAEGGIAIKQENAGSLETARKLTELGKIPDVVAVADYEVIPNFLMPAHATWYARFARNRMVLAYSEESRFAADISAENWWEIVRRPAVAVGRSDPDRDPNGYRTLLVFQLAERFYRRPGLAAALLAAAPERNVRSKESDLVALLQAREFDYIWSYESMAQSAGLRYVRLPHEIDLSDPADSAIYGMARVRVAGRSRQESLTLRGQPIVYALTIPRGAPHPNMAERFVRYMASETGRRVLRRARLDALDRFQIVGTGAPDL